MGQLPGGYAVSVQLPGQLGLGRVREKQPCRVGVGVFAVRDQGAAELADFEMKEPCSHDKPPYR